MTDTDIRTPEQQIEGLMKVIELAAKLHRVNLVIYDPQGAPKLHKHSQLALTGAEHGRATEIVYIIGGYDVWIEDPDSGMGESMVASDLTLEEAAQVMADAYMYDKAAQVLARDYNLSTGGIEAFLENDEHREWLYTVLDQGSDQVLEREIARRSN